MEEEVVSKEEELLAAISWISETLEEYKVAAKDHKEYLQRMVGEIVDSCETVEEATLLLLTAYYRSNGLVLWKTITKLCDDFGIDYKDVKEGTCRVRCQYCKTEIVIKLKSRTHHDDFRKGNRKATCQECEERMSKEYKERQERQELSHLARLQELKSMPYTEYLKTDEWKHARGKALRKARYKCELCFSGPPLNTHHKTYVRRGEEEASDLIVLCEACHAKFHDKFPKTERERDSE